jgi:hypothetical protein
VYTGGIVTYNRQQPTFRVVMLVVLITVALLVTLFVPLSALPTAANVPSGHTGSAYHPWQTVIADCAPSIKVQSCLGLHYSSFQMFLSGIVSLQLGPSSKTKEADARLYPLQARPALFQRPPPFLATEI